MIAAKNGPNNWIPLSQVVLSVEKRKTWGVFWRSTGTTMDLLEEGRAKLLGNYLGCVPQHAKLSRSGVEVTGAGGPRTNCNSFYR